MDCLLTYDKCMLFPYPDDKSRMFLPKSYVGPRDAAVPLLRSTDVVIFCVHADVCLCDCWLKVSCVLFGEVRCCYVWFFLGPPHSTVSLFDSRLRD